MAKKRISIGNNKISLEGFTNCRSFESDCCDLPDLTEDSGPDLMNMVEEQKLPESNSNHEYDATIDGTDKPESFETANERFDIFKLIAKESEDAAQSETPVTPDEVNNGTTDTSMGEPATSDEYPNVVIETDDSSGDVKVYTEGDAAAVSQTPLDDETGTGDMGDMGELEAPQAPTPSTNSQIVSEVSENEAQTNLGDDDLVPVASSSEEPEATTSSSEGCGGSKSTESIMANWF